MNQVRVFVQDFDKKGDRQGYEFFTSDWSLPRKHVFTYLTEAEGQSAAEEAFHIFNAPPSMLEEWQQFITKSYTGPSLSVGDIVEVNGQDFLCCSFGWEKREDAVAIN